MPKPLTPTSIKFTPEQKQFLERLARAQKHKQISKTVKRIIDSLMVASSPRTPSPRRNQGGCMGFWNCDNPREHQRQGERDFERGGSYGYDREKYMDHFDDCSRAYRDGFDEAKRQQDYEDERQREREEAERAEHRRMQDQQEQLEQQRQWEYEEDQRQRAEYEAEQEAAYQASQPQE